MQRRFTALLNFTLRAAHHDELVWHPKKKIVYYQASSDLSKQEGPGPLQGQQGPSVLHPLPRQGTTTRPRSGTAGITRPDCTSGAGPGSGTWRSTRPTTSPSTVAATPTTTPSTSRRSSGWNATAPSTSWSAPGRTTSTARTPCSRARDERILFGGLLTIDADAAIDEKAWLPPPDPPAPAPAEAGLLAGLWDAVMKARLIDEPELEFRARNRHIDPRYGIAVYGPADADSPSAPRDIPVGLVGPSWAIDGMRGWLERCRTRIEAKEAKPGQENLHQPFPGFSTDTNFGAGLVFDDALVREIPDRQLRLLAKADVKAAIAEGAGLYADAARSLAETGRCRVILCARPEEIREHDSEPPAPGGGGNADGEEEQDAETPRSAGTSTTCSRPRRSASRARCRSCAGKPGKAPSGAATSRGPSRTRPPGRGTCTSRCTTRPAEPPGGCRAATPTCPPATSASASTGPPTARNFTPPSPRSSTSAATASSSAAAPRRSPRPTASPT